MNKKIVIKIIICAFILTVLGLVLFYFYGNDKLKNIMKNAIQKLKE